MSSTPEVYYFRVAPRKHTGEGILILVTLAALFVLLAVLVGHPKPPPHAEIPVPAHASISR